MADGSVGNLYLLLGRTIFLLRMFVTCHLSMQESRRKHLLVNSDLEFVTGSCRITFICLFIRNYTSNSLQSVVHGMGARLQAYSGSQHPTGIHMGA